MCCLFRCCCLLLSSCLAVAVLCYVAVAVHWLLLFDGCFCLLSLSLWLSLSMCCLFSCCCLLLFSCCCPVLCSCCCPLVVTVWLLFLSIVIFSGCHCQCVVCLAVMVCCLFGCCCLLLPVWLFSSDCCLDVAVHCLLSDRLYCHPLFVVVRVLISTICYLLWLSLTFFFKQKKKKKENLYRRFLLKNEKNWKLLMLAYV